MTRAYALTKLLEHGPLTAAEIIVITGWPAHEARRTIDHLASRGRIERQDGKWTK